LVLTLTFKNDWEKTEVAYEINSQILEKIVLNVGGDISKCHLIPGGCANLNYKLIKAEGKSTLLRIYIRDPDAAYRERKLSELTNIFLPVPNFTEIIEEHGYTISVIEFIKGITLRDLLLNYPGISIEQIMYEVGSHLSKLQKIRFPQSGFFDKDCNIKETLTLSMLNKYFLEVVTSDNFKKYISHQSQKFITANCAAFAKVLDDISGRELVHGDFDPANILMKRYEGSWRVSGILDWEFSHSGTYLLDVANMLRYGHKMPSTYQDGFLKGLKDGNVKIPNNWQELILTFNLLSVLESLTKIKASLMPKRLADTQELIEYISRKLAVHYA